MQRNQITPQQRLYLALHFIALLLALPYHVNDSLPPARVNSHYRIAPATLLYLVRLAVSWTYYKTSSMKLSTRTLKHNHGLQRALTSSRPDHITHIVWNLGELSAVQFP